MSFALVLEGTPNVSQIYFNILQGLMFQGKDFGKYFTLNHEMQDCYTLGKQNFLV